MSEKCLLHASKDYLVRVGVGPHRDQLKVILLLWVLDGESLDRHLSAHLSMRFIKAVKALEERVFLLLFFV